MIHLLNKPITITDKTFLKLRKDIVDGNIAAGSKLNEKGLSTRYSVSRAVIRECLNRLDACHLIELKANIGARVVVLTHDKLLNLYKVRESLEGMAARLAAANMTDDEITDLKKLLNMHLETIKNKDSYYQESGDVDFHYRIVLGSKNNYLISILIDGLYHLVRMYRVQLGMIGPRIIHAFDEHKNIVKAIANRDGELAEMLMRRHISYAENDWAEKYVSKKI